MQIKVDDVEELRFSFSRMSLILWLTGASDLNQLIIFISEADLCPVIQLDVSECILSDS